MGTAAAVADLSPARFASVDAGAGADVSFSASAKWAAVLIKLTKLKFKCGAHKKIGQPTGTNQRTEN